MKEYRWEILSGKKPKDLKEIVEILLSNRGLKTEEEIKDFFLPKDPLYICPEDVGIEVNELKKAIKRIQKAIVAKEKIIVYGDYDADGVCATAVLWETINRLGGKVLPYIPDRIVEGYGLNEDSITKLKEGDPDLKLIVTVDHGIVGNKKIDFANELGVEVIVSDHHQPGGTKPKALAVVHTTMLSGSGVAWIMAKELLGSTRVARELLELVALGTIADLVPLIGPNRSLVKEGLEQIRKTKRPGLKALMEISRLDPPKIGTYEVGFILTPRLNAMGRMEHAIDSLRILCTNDEKRAGVLAADLDRTNRERQLLTEETVLHAKQRLLTKSAEGKKALIFIAHESYQQGIIGLVAGRLAEEYYQPTIIVSRGEKFSKASARSIQGFDIIKAIREVEELLEDVGGHPMAAGFTIETAKLEVLEKKLEEFVLSVLGQKTVDRVLKVDVAVEFSQAGEDLSKELDKFSPFGQGNREPVFGSFGVEVIDARVVGAGGKHLKLVLGKGNLSSSTDRVEAIGFGMGEDYQKFPSGSLVDIAYNVEINEWNGAKRLQLRLRDLKIHDVNEVDK